MSLQFIFNTSAIIFQQYSHVITISMRPLPIAYTLLIEKKASPEII